MYRKYNIKTGTAFAIAILSIVTIFSAMATVADPTAEWDKEILSVLWMMGLTAATMGLISSMRLQSRTEWVIVVFAWGIRVIYATLNNAGLLVFRGDDFFSMAWGLYYGYDHVINGTYPVITNYPPVLLAEFRIFGINRFVTCYVNAFFTMVAIFYLIKCFRLLRFSRRMEEILLFIFSFNPFSILFGSEVFREALYLLLITISLYCFIKWALNRKPVDAIVAMVAVAPVAWLHTGYIMIAVGYFVIVLLYLGRMNANRLLYKILCAVSIVCAVIFLVASGFIEGVNLGKLNMLKDLSGFPDYFDMVQTSVNSDAGSHYLKWMTETTSIFAMLLYTPIRMFYFLYSPMIWDCYRLKDVAIFLTDSLVFLAALIGILKVIINKKWKRTEFKDYRLVLVVSVLIIILMIIPFAWGTFNAGTAIRHRNCLLPFICIQIGICTSLNRHKSS